MGIFKGVTDSISGTLADQWKDIITAGQFTEQLAVAPGIHQTKNNSRGVNTKGSVGVISNGSIVRVPEKTAAFIFHQSGIEQIVDTSGEFIYNNGSFSVFNGDDIYKSLFKQPFDRLGFGGQAHIEKKISFVNLREIRGLNFNTVGPLMYNDQYYGVDLEVISKGVFSIQITDPRTFVQNYLPANVKFYSFDEENAKSQIFSEFIQSFIQALNSLSNRYRISELPAASKEIVTAICSDKDNAGSWESRFGFKLVNIGIDQIQLSDDSRALINKYTSSKMDVKAYEETSTKASNIAAQQKIAEGVKQNGLGESAGMIFGMNMAQTLNPTTANSTTITTMSVGEQINTVKQLKDLLDSGVLTQDEFDRKKKEIMNL